jgi:hypothetical protein
LLRHHLEARHHESIAKGLTKGAGQLGHRGKIRHRIHPEAAKHLSPAVPGLASTHREGAKARLGVGGKQVEQILAVRHWIVVVRVKA